MPMSPDNKKNLLPGGATISKNSPHISDWPLDHKEDEAETWHTCKGHCPLQKLCFLFRSDKNSGCYGNL